MSRSPRSVFRVLLFVGAALGGGSVGYIFFDFLIMRESLFDEQAPLVQRVLQPAQDSLLQGASLTGCSLDRPDPSLHLLYDFSLLLTDLPAFQSGVSLALEGAGGIDQALRLRPVPSQCSKRTFIEG